MNLLGIDPGVTTGYCFSKLDQNENVLTVKPAQFVDDVDEMWDRIKKFEPRYIVMEDFEFRQRTRAGLNLFPVQLIGIARLYSLRAPQCAIFLQKASQGKSYYTDNVLKQKGLYKRGVNHGIDATRHLLHWITFGAGFQFNNKVEINLL